MPDLREALQASGYKLSDQRMTQQGRTLIIDGRESGGIGADGKLLSSFCAMYATVENQDRVRVTLLNAPTSREIAAWLRAIGAEASDNEPISFTVRVGEQARLAELAAMVRAVVRPGARYPVSYWKYSSEEVAISLLRFRDALDRAWSDGASPDPEPRRLLD